MPNPIYIKTSLYDGRITKHPLYQTFLGMKQRCLRPKHQSYKRYGGAGITIFQEWLDNSAAFLIWIDEHLGLRPNGYSLDRIDPFGNYEPENLRWASASTQAKNIRNPEERARKCSELNSGDNNCSKRPEVRKKISKKMKENWADSNSTYNSNEYRQNLSNMMLERWSDPNSTFNSSEYREKVSKIRKDLPCVFSEMTGEKNTMADPVIREKHKNIMKRKVWVFYGNVEEYITDNLFHFYHIAGWQYGRVISEETLKKRRKLSKALTGENHPNFGKPSWNRGKKASIETRQKMRNRERKTCPHCGKNVVVTMYARWHGERCPMNPERN